jgi:hypothetical protein
VFSRVDSHGAIGAAEPGVLATGLAGTARATLGVTAGLSDEALDRARFSRPYTATSKYTALAMRLEPARSHAPRRPALGRADVDGRLASG